MNYAEILEKNNLFLHSDGLIYKHGKNNRNRPICNNEIFQDLVIKRQNGTITPREDNLLGNCIKTLIRIVLNNHKFRYQDDLIRDEIVTEACIDTFSAMNEKLFDETKGKAYSYFFRLIYVAGIHVLRRWNDKIEADKALLDAFDEMYGNHCGGKVCTDLHFD